MWLSAHAATDGVTTIEVADEGPGIPPEEAERVFERFHRVDAARAARDGGTGLGLAIARWIVDAHGGTIAVRAARAPRLPRGGGTPAMSDSPWIDRPELPGRCRAQRHARRRRRRRRGRRRGTMGERGGVRPARRRVGAARAARWSRSRRACAAAVPSSAPPLGLGADA